MGGVYKFNNGDDDFPPSRPLGWYLVALGVAILSILYYTL